MHKDVFFVPAIGKATKSQEDFDNRKATSVSKPIRLTADRQFEKDRNFLRLVLISTSVEMSIESIQIEESNLHIFIESLILAQDERWRRG